MLKMVNKSLIILRWEAPFTWNYTTIRHYNVYIHSSLNTWNWSNYTKEMIEFRAIEDMPECTEFNFTVVASNEFGDSEMGTITGGFPISKWSISLSVCLSACLPGCFPGLPACLSICLSVCLSTSRVFQIMLA